MRTVLFILAVAICGVGLGAGSAWYSIQGSHGIGAINVGPWTAFPFAGQTEVDPYTVAKSVADGSVPLGATEGLAFEAQQDSQGEPMRLDCSYVLEGRTPPSKLWTLVAYERGGKPAAAAPGGQSSLYSGALLRYPDGSFTITAASEPRPGNWLAIGGSGGLRLVLRLYDTTITANTGLAPPDMPTINRVSCAS